MSTNQNISSSHRSPNRERNGYVLTGTDWQNRAITHTHAAAGQLRMIEERGPAPGNTHRNRLQEETPASVFLFFDNKKQGLPPSIPRSLQKISLTASGFTSLVRKVKI